MLAEADKLLICPVVIGRARHLGILQQLVEHARSGAGRTVLIAGEAGIGKTRLVAEVKGYAASRGFVLLQGCCFEQDRACPYAPFLDLLYTRLASLPAAQREHELRQLPRELWPLLPDALAAAERPVLASEQEKRRLYAAFTQYCLDQAARQPLLLLIEDLHWSDDSSLELLQLLARHAAAHPVLIVLTYRSDEAAPALRQLLAQFDRERLAQELKLQRLQRSETAAMLRAIFELQRPVSPRFSDTIYDLTEGNPFFIEETLKSLFTTGDLVYNHAPDGLQLRPLRELRIPRSVQEAVQGRTVRLGSKARELLALAAVAGRRFDFSLLQTLMHYDELELLRLLKELIAAQLIVEESADIYAFRHALTREAIYADLLARERRALHQRIAETIEQRCAAEHEPGHAELAYHFYQAGVWQQALHYAEHAGDQAAGLYATREAVEHYSRAIEAAEQLGAPAWQLRSKRGKAYERLGERAQAHDDYQAVLKLAQTRNEPGARWQALIDLGFLWLSTDYLQAGQYFGQALDLARTMDDPAVIAHSLNRLGNWHLHIEQPQEAQRCHQEALSIFQRVNDAAGIAGTLDLLGTTLFLGGDLVQGYRYIEQAVALFEAQNDRFEVVARQLVLANMLEAGYFQDNTALPSNAGAGLPDDATLLHTIREGGWRALEVVALTTQAQRMGARGEFQRALEYVQLGHSIAEEIGHQQWTVAALFTLGRLYLDMLTFPQAQQQLEQGLQLAQALGSRFWASTLSGALASTFVQQNNLRRAEGLLSEVFAPSRPPQTLGQRHIWCAAIELQLARGNFPQALLLVDQLIALAQPTAHGPIIPRLAWLRAEALSGLQRHTEAETLLQAAERLLHAANLKPQLWRVQVDLGQLYSGQGRQSEADQAYSAAHDLIAELAGELSETAFRDPFLRRASRLLPSAYALTPRALERLAFAGLTARELEVATLIALHKSNREIAEALVVGERTIETHVSNILSKLNFSSRKEIIAWAREKGLA